MGEKGNVEVIEELREMAKKQEPGLRDQVEQLLNDYSTITGLTTAVAAEEAEESGPAATPPQA